MTLTTLTSPDFLSALLSIIVIDLVLAGDNAIVIAMAAQNVPKSKQLPVIIWGTVAAILIRSLATLGVVYLLKIPFLLGLGGLVLLRVAYKLLTAKKKHSHLPSGSSIWIAVQTIVVADIVMGLDNVLAIAGAAHGSILIVVLGLLISVPIVIWGSTMFLKWIERFPILLYMGAIVLVYTASTMLLDEPMLRPYLGADPTFRIVFSLVLILYVLLAAWWRKRRTP
ncbi:MAG TPA: TerC family protein [Bacilli bacterium]|nr:TerC family protein [Bacilli bacterium]